MVLDTSLQRQFDRLPPMSLEAEMVALSALMVAGDPKSAAFVETMAILDREAFYQKDHQAIFDAIVALAERGDVDGFLVAEEMDKRGTLGEAGGHEYLSRVINAAPTAEHGPEYATIVRERWVARQLLSFANDVRASIYADSTLRAPSVAIGQDAANRLARILSHGAATDSETAAVVYARMVNDLAKDEPGSVKTGFTEFDEITGGIYFGEMMILAARPSMGKSAMAKQIAYQVAASGTPVALISQEESKLKIVRNLTSYIGGVDNHRMRKPSQLTEQDWGGIHAVGPQLEIPLYLNNSRNLRDVRAAAAALVARHGCKLLVIDYLQRINAPGNSRYEKVTEVSQGISDLIKELNIAGLVLAQINRETARRDEKRPNMEDLKESGQIEQDADGVVFLHREDYYHLDSADYEPTGIAELIIAKWRDGMRNKVIKLESDLRHQGFKNRKGVGISGMSDVELAGYGL